MEFNPGQPDPPVEEGMLRVLHVVPGVGPYQTIQEAINEASPGTVILIASALYTQPIVINKPGLVLEARDSNPEVQLTCAYGPIVTVSLSEGETCAIRGIKLIHTAASAKRIEPKGSMESEAYLDVFETNKSSEHWVKNIKVSNSMNCGLWVNGGQVLLENSNVILSSAKNPIPGVVCSSGHLDIRNSRIKGNGEVPSVGVYVLEADLSVYRSKIYRHRGGGMVLYGSPKCNILINESKVFENVNCGIYLLGVDAKQVIQKSKVTQNEGAGIKIGHFNCSVVKGCEVTENEKGIEVQNANPFIFLNIIKSNTEEGVSFTGTEGSRCDGKCMSNDIFENENGIVCSGVSCFAKVEGNGKISNNEKAGVRVVNNAHVSIIKNEIFENQTQGVLLVKGSSAHIERNNIFKNKKANIAFGGCENSDTTIIENSIFQSCAEGIFNLEGGTSWIKRNSIFENADGIVLVDSHPVITMNSVYDNLRSGLTIAGYSQPNVADNEFLRNTAVGINIRDKASGLIVRNYAIGNLVPMAVITKTKMNLKQIKNENYIKGEIQLPLPTLCSLL